MPMEEVFLPFRLVAAFADGSRHTFDGLTEAAARNAMEAAQAVHGDLTWWDGVTDLHYESGRYIAMIPQPPEIAIIDITDKDV